MTYEELYHSGAGGMTAHQRGKAGRTRCGKILGSKLLEVQRRFAQRCHGCSVSERQEKAKGGR